MPTPKNHRRGIDEKSKKGRLTEKASSFHGKIPETTVEMLPRPRTVPDLLSGKSNVGGVSTEGRPKLTKLLLNVTIQRSTGAVQMVMSPEATVDDLIAAAVRQYAKEGRRPILPSNGPSSFDLHYSQFSLESLNREEKLMSLGSRNFFLCLTEPTTENGVTGAITTTQSSSPCSKQADMATKIGLTWLKFMDFLL